MKIAVLKKYEGLGIEKRLSTLVETWLNSAGWQEIWLTTDREEIRAVGFYRHCGWHDWYLEPEGRMVRTEPMALATGVEGTDVPPVTPAASAVGSRKRTFSPSQPEGDRYMKKVFSEIDQVGDQT